MGQYAVVKNDYVENVIVCEPEQVEEMEEALQAELVDAWPFGLTIGDLRVAGNWTRNVGGVQEVLTEKATYEELEAALYELQAALNSSEESTETGAETE